MEHHQRIVGPDSLRGLSLAPTSAVGSFACVTTNRTSCHPNPHIAFGCGEHSCLGAQLARLEATVLFDELLRRFPRLELVGEVDRMRATMIPGVKRMPVQLVLQL
jgi:cytochrome P450